MTPNPHDEDIREWEGAAFDPQALRHFSLLPDEDADEAYCVRHDREMQQMIPVIHHNGALYTTSEGFACYTCGNCLGDVFTKAMQSQRDIELPPDAGPEDILRAQISKLFAYWDDGEAPADWFQFSREEPSGEYDTDTRYVWLAPTRADAHELIAGRGGSDD